jgi:hypothetical protein
MLRDSRRQARTVAFGDTDAGRHRPRVQRRITTGMHDRIRVVFGVNDGGPAPGNICD